jgi:galactokinase
LIHNAVKSTDDIRKGMNMSDNALQKMVIDQHKQLTGKLPAVTSFAPGRIEVLGNHTDYNDGLVLAAAVEEGIFCALSKNDNAKIEFHALDLDEHAAYPLVADHKEDGPSWSKYLLGVCRLLFDGPLPHGITLSFSGTIPRGMGLSSSAALEVATAYALLAAFDRTMDPIEIAKKCQRAEQEYSGVQCGLLDQLSSVKGKQDHLIQIDFRDLSIRYEPFSSEVIFLICHAGGEHALVDGAYNERRADCHRAVEEYNRITGSSARALRDISVDQLNAVKGKIDDRCWRRAAHVVGENQRVTEAEMALLEKNWERMGQLMLQSHQSSKDLFENSSHEQDAVVRLAQKIDGIYGARLSGGGFGGNVLMLVNASKVDVVLKEFKKELQEIGHASETQTVRPSNGAQTAKAC